MDHATILFLRVILVMNLSHLSFIGLESVNASATGPSKQTHLSNDSSRQAAESTEITPHHHDCTVCQMKVFSARHTNAYKQKVKRGAGLAEEGMQIAPQLTLEVTDAVNRPLTSSGSPPELLVGDSVRFVIQLTKDSNYNIYSSLEVMACTMSTSAVMPDPTAVTRVLLINGCPLEDEVTSDSWYWTSEMSTSTTFIINTQPVSIFRLSSSEYVYLHCSMKMCFTNSASCKQPDAANCTALQLKRKKRYSAELPSLRYHRSADGITNVNETLALRVIEPQQMSSNPFQVGTSTFIALVILLSITGLAIIVLIILVIVYIWRQPINKYQRRPQQFAEQRITPSKRRCMTCL